MPTRAASRGCARVGSRAVALIARTFSRLFTALPPRSRLRQAMVRSFVQHGFEATNRRDFTAAFAIYHPDVESIFPQEFVALGFERVCRRRQARIEVQRRWVAEWAISDSSSRS